MEAFMWRHQPRSLAAAGHGRARRNRRVAADPFLVLRSHRARRLAARSGPGRWCALGRRLLRRQHGTILRPARSRTRSRPWQTSGPTGVDLSLAANLRFPGGILASIDCSFEQPFRCAYELVGTKGVIEVPDAYLPPAAGPPIARLRTLGSHSDSDAGGDVVKTLEFVAADQYAEMVDAFARSVAAGRLVDPAEDGLAQMKVLDADPVVRAISETVPDEKPSRLALNETSVPVRPPRRPRGCGRSEATFHRRARGCPRCRTDCAGRGADAS